MRNTLLTTMCLLALASPACDPVVRVISFNVEPRRDRCPRDTVNVTWEVADTRPDAPRLRTDHETNPNLIGGRVVRENGSQPVEVLGPDPITFTLGGGGAPDQSHTVTFYRRQVYDLNMAGFCRGVRGVVYETGNISSEISPRATPVSLTNTSRFPITVEHGGISIIVPRGSAATDPFGPVRASGPYRARPVNPPAVRCPVAVNEPPPPNIDPVSILVEVDCQ